jgi:hypothetical protein
MFEFFSQHPSEYSVQSSVISQYNRAVKCNGAASLQTGLCIFALDLQLIFIQTTFLT